MKPETRVEVTVLVDYVITTGDYIAEWMEREGVNAAELSRRLDITPKHAKACQ